MSFATTTTTPFVMEIDNNHRLLHEADEYEDDNGGDAFYDELRRRVLKLTEEDEDCDDYAAEYVYGNNKAATNTNHYLGSEEQRSKGYLNWQINEDYEAPAAAWMLKNLWRSSVNVVSGTGVFIPQVASRPRRNRRNRNRKRKSERDVTKKTAVETIS